MTQFSTKPFAKMSKTLSAIIATIAITGAMTGCAMTDADNNTQTKNMTVNTSLITHVYQPNNHQPIESVKMFPAPANNMRQHIIVMPEQANETNFMIELQPGITMNADCNVRMMSGKLKAESLQGWGYQYFEMTRYMQGPTTMMMCNEPSTERFIPIGEPTQIRYNSRLPKVIYLPEDVELQFRVWQAPEAFSTTK
ncbi:serine protease inhibitor ecotin [Shewanella maritima]|uniref:serine protease inhibitor ecotin n=1 Tax=Shewanella maritima TaxID=2520507 RepID=UPI003734C951